MHAAASGELSGREARRIPAPRSRRADPGPRAVAPIPAPGLSPDRALPAPGISPPMNTRAEAVFVDIWPTSMIPAIRPRNINPDPVLIARRTIRISRRPVKTGARPPPVGSAAPIRPGTASLPRADDRRREDLHASGPRLAIRSDTGFAAATAATVQPDAAVCVVPAIMRPEAPPPASRARHGRHGRPAEGRRRAQQGDPLTETRRVTGAPRQAATIPPGSRDETAAPAVFAITNGIPSFRGSAAALASFAPDFGGQAMVEPAAPSSSPRAAAGAAASHGDPVEDREPGRHDGGPRRRRVEEAEPRRHVSRP